MSTIRRAGANPLRSAVQIGAGRILDDNGSQTGLSSVVCLDQENSSGISCVCHQDRPAADNLFEHDACWQSCLVDLYAFAWRNEAVRLNRQAVPECTIMFPLASLLRRRPGIDGMNTLQPDERQGSDSNHSKDYPCCGLPELTSA
jgi:hypothetical protein